MMRFWLGIAILAVLLGLSLGVQEMMQTLHDPIAENLEQAAQAALDGDWERADGLSTKARHAWERNHGLTASIADHNPMDELDMLFAELGVFQEEREGIHFAATCRSAAQMAQAMYQAHNFTWWNLL